MIGGGAWGTALAVVASARGPVTLWAREAEVVTSVNSARENAVFLPGVALPGAVRATRDLAAVAACDALIVAVPVQHLRGVLEDAGLGPSSPMPLLLCAKGIEAGTAMLPSEIATDVANHPRLSPNQASAQPELVDGDPQARTGLREAPPERFELPLAVLSGPSFAAEVARGLPTALTLACADAALGAAWVVRLGAPAFRLYASDDCVGAEVGGAVKNVLAVAAGVVIGCGLGENARAALIARGFVEMVRYGIARGGRAETMAGLSGLGDLVLTCGSTASRNMTLGMALGGGAAVADALARARGVAEGAATAPVLAADARARGVAMPIVDAVADLLGGAEVGEIVERLLARPARGE